MSFYDLKPQLAAEKDGPEPSIRELLMYYYVEYGKIPYCKAKEFTEQYIKEIEKIREEPMEMFISGPNSYAMVKLGKVKTSKLIRNSIVNDTIDCLCLLTGDDEQDYTCTMLNQPRKLNEKL